MIIKDLILIRITGDISNIIVGSTEVNIRRLKLIFVSPTLKIFNRTLT